MWRFFPSILAIVLQVAGTHAQPPDLPPPDPGRLPSDVVPVADAELIERLIQNMADPDAEVRQNLATAAAQLGRPAVGPLTIALKDEQPDRRAAAAYALGQIGRFAASAVPELLDAVTDESPAVRRQASYAISRILAEVNRRPVVPLSPPPSGLPGIGVQP